MKRLILSMLLLVMVTTAYPQLGGRLGKIVDRGNEKVDIIQIDFASLDAETAQHYIDGIRNYVNKKDILKYSNDPQELEKELEKNGIEKARFSGYHSKDEIIKMVSAYIK